MNDKQEIEFLFRFSNTLDGAIGRGVRAAQRYIENLQIDNRTLKEENEKLKERNSKLEEDNSLTRIDADYWINKYYFEKSGGNR
jgi:cell division protein FtsB